MTLRNRTIRWISQRSSRWSVFVALGLFVTVSGCTTGVSKQNGEPSAGTARDAAPPLSRHEADPQRQQALEVLWKAYTEYHLGRVTDAMRDVDKALSIDPNLAYANIVKGEIALKAEDWQSARASFERGLELLRDPDQPLSPVDSVKIGRAHV